MEHLVGYYLWHPFPAWMDKGPDAFTFTCTFTQLIAAICVHWLEFATRSLTSRRARWQQMENDWHRVPSKDWMTMSQPGSGTTAPKIPARGRKTNGRWPRDGERAPPLCKGKVRMISYHLMGWSYDTDILKSIASNPRGRTEWLWRHSNPCCANSSRSVVVNLLVSFNSHPGRANTHSPSPCSTTNSLNKQLNIHLNIHLHSLTALCFLSSLISHRSFLMQVSPRTGYKCSHSWTQPPDALTSPFETWSITIEYFNR